MPNVSVPAAATGLPDDTRRGFLRGLAALPLIGGGVSILGAPTAVASAPTFQMLLAYREWLHNEGRLLAMELFPELGSNADAAIFRTPAAKFHFPAGKDWRDLPQPSTRAALVMATVGCPYRGTRDA